MALLLVSTVNKISFSTMMNHCLVVGGPTRIMYGSATSVSWIACSMLSPFYKSNSDSKHVH